MWNCNQQTLQQQICNFAGTSVGCKRAKVQRHRGGKRLQVVAVGWDPEGILRAPQGDHISRRTMSKQVEDNKEMQADLAKREAELKAEMEQSRQARKQPTTQAQVIEYLLSTETGEMQYETARCRPQLDDSFFAYLDSQIAEQRFASPMNENRLAELESLREFLKETVALLDSRTKQIAAPAERLKALLMSKDKKAAILEMAESNQIDEPLLNLLKQNADAARAAGQPEPAEFMEKIRDAARKFLIK
ncbi:hypothetical protein WJX79_007452 [Trebouxia sp. C0005]|nr:MAG: uncharacterized protein FRX49_02643 [Trebouxia sp. A1-2]